MLNYLKCCYELDTVFTCNQANNYCQTDRNFSYQYFSVLIQYSGAAAAVVVVIVIQQVNNVCAKEQFQLNLCVNYSIFVKV